MLAKVLILSSKGDGYHAIGQATSDAAIGRYGFLMTTVFVALGTGELLPGRLEREFRADYFEGWLSHEPSGLPRRGLTFMIYVMRTRVFASSSGFPLRRSPGWMAG